MPPLDPYRKVYTPDFQAPQVDLPQWQNLGEQSSAQSTAPMMDMLKQRIGGGGAGGKGAAPIGAAGKAGAGGAGGMNSL